MARTLVVDNPAGRVFVVRVGGGCLLVLDVDGESVAIVLDAADIVRVVAALTPGRQQQSTSEQQRPKRTRATNIDYEEVARVYQSDEGIGRREQHLADYFGINVSTARSRALKARQLGLITSRYLGESSRLAALADKQKAAESD